MRYSIEPRDMDGIFDMDIKGYGFLSFVKNMGKNLSNEYSQKLLYSTKKSATDAIKTASKRAIQTTAEATGDLIGNKITDKRISVSTGLHPKNSLKELQNHDMETPKKDIYLQKKGNKLLMN